MQTISHNGTTFYRLEDAHKYYVSRCGQVYSARSNKRMNPATPNMVTGKPGYPQVWMTYNDGAQRWQKVHRLVALAFIPNPENKSDVNHKDGNKQNPHVDNLEWMTRSENIQHGIAAGLITHKRGADHHLHGKKPTPEARARMQAAKRGQLHPKFTGYYLTPFGRFASANECERETGTSAKSVQRWCKQGKRKAEGWDFEPRQ